MTSHPGHVTTPKPLPATEEEGAGCGELSVSDVWVSGFAKLMTESSLRLLDVNADGVLDVLLGFATGTGPRVELESQFWTKLFPVPVTCCGCF